MELNNENIKINMMSHPFFHHFSTNPLAAFHHPFEAHTADNGGYVNGCLEFTWTIPFVILDFPFILLIPRLTPNFPFFLSLSTFCPRAHPHIPFPRSGTI